MMVMSKTQTAPGDLELLREFVNSADREAGEDRLDSPEGLVGWMAEQGLLEAGSPAGAADLRHAVELREAVRAILLAHANHDHDEEAPGAVLDAAARRGHLHVAFAGDGSSRLVAEADGVDGALGRLMAIAHAAQSDGTWERLKACPWHTCQWAFYDHTKNRSGRWCTMDVCGNRAKAAAYRRRRAGAV
jgi:predicted RNA-binding Zn ribbon-like protein